MKCKNCVYMDKWSSTCSKIKYMDENDKLENGKAGLVITAMDGQGLSWAVRVTPDFGCTMFKERKNKYLYVWRLWVNYGQGWEHETDETEYKGYIANRKAYRENCLYPQKWTRARILND